MKPHIPRPFLDAELRGGCIIVYLSVFRGATPLDSLLRDLFSIYRVGILIKWATRMTNWMTIRETYLVIKRGIHTAKLMRPMRASDCTNLDSNK